MRHMRYYLLKGQEKEAKRSIHTAVLSVRHESFYRAKGFDMKMAQKLMVKSCERGESQRRQQHLGYSWAFGVPRGSLSCSGKPLKYCGDSDRRG